MYRVSINKQAADTLWRLERGERDTTGLDAKFLNNIVSMVYRGGEKINDDHDRDYTLLRIVQQPGDTV